ncbi:CgeB family protein [Corallococcus terminator]|uniref:Glycosyltransferase n=1 Tax=Corallococcus terminator TaxID=2316733 RepID=A0A3A8J0Y5_9BACT|nr:glycosyltransferase [Corallococcus terminator]RKG84211.1 glycosyltransferase [Corallococcus terminator]
MDIVFLGPPCEASAEGAQGTASRLLAQALRHRGHAVLLLEQALSGGAWLEGVPSLAPYLNVADLHARFRSRVRRADLVLVDADVPRVAEVGRWATDTARGLTVCWDRDTPRTLRQRHPEDASRMTPGQLAAYHLCLCSCGGPVPGRLERDWGVARARAFPPGVHPEHFAPRPRQGMRWDLGHLGPLSPERRVLLGPLLFGAARDWPEGRFVLAGGMSVVDAAWASNVTRQATPASREHPDFHAAQRFTLALSPAEHSPGPHLFEAAACGAALICDPWPGLEDLFSLGEEVVVARTAKDVLLYLREMPEADRLQLGARARERVLAEHTVAHRALTLERYAHEAVRGASAGAPVRGPNPLERSLN